MFKLKGNNCIFRKYSFNKMKGKAYYTNIIVPTFVDTEYIMLVDVAITKKVQVTFNTDRYKIWRAIDHYMKTALNRQWQIKNVSEKHEVVDIDKICVCSKPTYKVLYCIKSISGWYHWLTEYTIHDKLTFYLLYFSK